MLQYYNNNKYLLKKIFERGWCQVRDRNQLIRGSFFCHLAKEHGFKNGTALGQIDFMSLDELWKIMDILINFFFKKEKN